MPGFESRKRKGILFSPERLDTILGQPNLLIHGYAFGFKAIRPRIWPLTPSGADVKYLWSYTSTPLYVLMTWTGTPLPLRTFVTPVPFYPNTLFRNLLWNNFNPAGCNASDLYSKGYLIGILARFSWKRVSYILQALLLPWLSHDRVVPNFSNSSFTNLPSLTSWRQQYRQRYKISCQEAEDANSLPFVTGILNT